MADGGVGVGQLSHSFTARGWMCQMVAEAKAAMRALVAEIEEERRREG